MIVSAFGYVRNGFTIDYPFLESIQSVLPIVDEFIAVVGDSTDGTREAIENLNNPKIKIVDTIWSEKMRSGGLIFAQQANIGLDACRADADWLFHIQADEIIHENDLPKIRQAMLDNLDNKKVEGLLFKFYNFYGDYNHYAPSRRYHQHEIRIIRNNKNIRSYRDSQGFRLYTAPNKTEVEKGEKLHVKLIDAYVYHYSHCKPPQKQQIKKVEFGHRYFGKEGQAYDHFDNENTTYYYNMTHYRDYDYLKKFNGSHPKIMSNVINHQDWKFEYDPKKNNMKPKEKLLKWLEEITGKQFFIYKNYKLV